MTAKVYITQEVSYADYSDLDRFGEPIFLTANEISSAPNSLHNAKLAGMIRDRFKHYNPTVDFIVPSGSPLVTGLVFAIAREKSETFLVLKWNNRDRNYTPVKIGVQGEAGVN